MSFPVVPVATSSKRLRSSRLSMANATISAFLPSWAMSAMVRRSLGIATRFCEYLIAARLYATIQCALPKVVVRKRLCTMCVHAFQQDQFRVSWHASCVRPFMLVDSFDFCQFIFIADPIATMPYVVAEPCINCKYTDCVEVCPVDCFYEGPNFLAIHPDECIDCNACVPTCPTEAIYADDELPEKWAH